MLQALRNRGKNRRGHAAYAALILLLLSPVWCYAGDVVFIRSALHPSPEQHDLDIATRFYGLNLETVEVDPSYAAAALKPVKAPATLAVVIDADALSLLNQRALLQSLRRKSGDNVPLLILGATPQTDAGVLSRWSGANILGVAHLADLRRRNYVVGRVAGITEQLSGLEIPFQGDDTSYFLLTEDSAIRKIMMVQRGDKNVPVFIEAELPQQKIFLISRVRSSGQTARETADNVVDAFMRVAPVMMFVKHCAGEQGWHTVRHYANFTIDDPWLREPYGHLNYEGLLREMEAHNFHTTIAFIPWNYNRSEAAVVPLFRNHPDRLSICVHGNNHDHKEFEDLKSTPLDDQVADIEQALARMDKFQSLTGIAYDKVFVFPHSIGTEPVLEKLKAYNYLATVNSSNVPMDKQIPTDPLFALRPVTMSFGDFPSIARYSAAMENPTDFIAVNTFLDNPLLFYSHQDFFADGINAFDRMADEVNRIEPDTRWAGLGDIVNHLYLLRKRSDSNYDVLAFANSLTLENTSRRSAVFFITKRETASQNVTSVSVNGQGTSFHLLGGNLGLSVVVPAGETRNVVIRYNNDLNLASIEISHDSPRAYFLRKVSDFRDIAMSRYSIGEVLTALYYNDDGAAARTTVYVVLTLLLSLGVAGGGALIAKKRRKSC